MTSKPKHDAPSVAPLPDADVGATAGRMWGGRFAVGPHEAMAELNRSLPVDYRLWAYDVKAAQAWVAALQRAGMLSSQEEKRLLEGLSKVGDRLADGAGVGAPDEDVHSLVERLLYEEVGDVAGKLNTGRSRNDQVSTDLRLWCVGALAEVDREVALLGQALVGRAREGLELLLPGYTHQQPAQPVRWGFVLLAHAWPLVRDRERLAAAGERASELPLGSGAVAGSAVQVDREFLRDVLGFRRVSANALDATGERDFVVEIVFVLGLLATHLSRLAGELITYASAEYGFVRLSEEYCTGSSLLPQKRNPDALELARGKAARVLGDLTGLLALLRGLPAGYSKDLQEDKAFLFDAVDTVMLTLPAVRGLVETLEPVPERMSGALDPAMLATDAADELAARGVPFREAHALVGQAVRMAEALGVTLSEMPSDAAAEVHPALPGVLASLGTWSESIERRSTTGGSSRRSVMEQITALEEVFGK